MYYSFPPTILYGADYNPEQWPETTWLEDMRLMKLAGVNMVSLNIFSWATLQPRPEHYHFEQLDRVMGLLAEHGIMADLATATASPPTWMSRLYPAMLPMTRSGKRLSHGARQHYCPNSVDYRREAAQLAQRLAERYRGHPALRMWHVNNEYGEHVPACYCDVCAEAFRFWLQERYASLERLNEAWGTSFWSQHYSSWEDILPPRIAPAQNNPGQSLDFKRFMSDSLLACYQLEAEVLRQVTPDIPLTTNFTVAPRQIDGFVWAPHLDIISFDNYPSPTTPYWETAMRHDLMRSLKNGQPHLVMEQTPSQLNWMPQNPHKRPGNIRVQSLQAVAHGADGVLYFQWRQSLAGAEKFHSAVVSHSGREDERIFQQAARIGADLQKLSPHVVGARLPAQAALVMDWQNWWDVEYLPGPSDRLRYWEQLVSWYGVLNRQNITVDLVASTADLSGYRLVIAPLLHLLRPGTARNFEQFVERGGIFLTTFFSGIVDENDHVVPGGYPAELRRLLGIRVEEFDPLTPEMRNTLVIEAGPLQGVYATDLWGELVHLEGARALGVFGEDYYAQQPALTMHEFGQGRAYYLATQAEMSFMEKLGHMLCAEARLSPVLQTPVGVEVTRRVNGDGHSVYFLLNHTQQTTHLTLPPGIFTSLLDDKRVEGQIELAAQDILVLLETEGERQV